jgi:hypothetical protein
VHYLWNIDKDPRHVGLERDTHLDCGTCGMVFCLDDLKPVTGNFITGTANKNAAIIRQVFADVNRVT